MNIIDRRGLRAWGALGAALLVWQWTAGIHGIVQDWRHNDAEETYERRAEFWRVVAGEEDGLAPTVENKLARDLRELLGPRDSDATELPDEILRFRGDSNAYGGISDALGEDPFSGANCHECGPLDAEMKADLLQIKRGELDELLENEQPSDPGGDWGPSWELFALYAFGAPFALLCPTWWRRRREREQLVAGGAAEAQLLNEMAERLRELPPYHPKYDEFKQLHDGLRRELVKRAKIGETSVRNDRIDALAEEARVSLEAYRAGNRALNEGDEPWDDSGRSSRPS